jgi:polysaccharide export outer membrane protein
MKYLILIFVLFFVCIACSNQRKFTYFKDVSDTASQFNIADTGYKPVIIKGDDLLQINISSPNPEANTFFISPGASAANGNGTTASSSSNTNTYLVDKEGGIDLPLVGRVTVIGLNTVQAKNVIKKVVSPYLKDPIVTVRLLNFKVTVLGEVNKPGDYIVPNERVSLLDAVGMAGDLTIYGRRDNVLLIREHEGKKTLTRLNLNYSTLFQSPYYYLQQNDIIYIEPNKAKAATNDLAAIRNISILTTLATLASIIISQLRR